MCGSDKDDIRSSFFEECEQLLEMTQDALDELADDPHDMDAVNSVFRAVHSIKGGAGAFGLEAVVDFSHRFESAMDAVRSGEVDLTDDLLALFRQCGDNLSDLMTNAGNGKTGPHEASAQLELRLIDVTCDAENEAEPTDFKPLTMDLDAGVGGPATYTITFKAAPDLFASGNEPAVLFKALNRLGDVNVTAAYEGVPPLADLDADICFVTWHIVVITASHEAEVRDVFEFVMDCCTLEVENTAEHETGDAGSWSVADAPARDLPDLGDLIDSVGASGKPDQNAAKPSGNFRKREPATSNKKNKSSSTIRVDVERIDRLINLVGELVIKEAMLSQSIDELEIARNSGVWAGLDNLKQIASEIQEGVMAIRAQPLKPMFQRMARIAREAGSATGKKVRFVTIGDDTEVDNTVIESLVDPLTHMIRNAIDHGLEAPEDRAKAGKSPEGTITLSAAHRSGRVLIDVVDDGGGINRELVRNLAVERGLIEESDDLSPSEIDHLLFMPGFSSRSEVSELSGRGVGLDVVRSAIQKLGGRVAIQSDPGEGATFSISLPLTLAVLEGMIVDVGGETMVVPISSVQETVRPTNKELDRLGVDTLVLRNRGELVPVIDLGAFLGFRTVPLSLEDHVLLLIAADQGPRFALVVDEIQDQRQVVIKSLETNYKQISGVAAATILGDGCIALIIDTETIMRELGSGGPGEKPMKIAS